MIRKLFIACAVLLVAAACNNQQNTTNQSGSEEELTVANFASEAGNYVGKEVKIKGTVNHACKHGGKRMFIIDEGTEENVKIEAGANIDSFNADLEGSEVVVTGIVKEQVIDENYLDEWEKEVLEGQTQELTLHDGKHEGEANTEVESEEPVEGEEAVEGEEVVEGETEEDHHGTDLEKIENLRKMLRESEKDHLSFYSIECSSFEIAPPPTQENN